jgi:hypothetical protein
VAVVVVVSIARGHDASYPFKTIGAADSATITGERGAGYYLSAVEKGGEPAGTWVGNGAAELGFRDSDVVRREDSEPLFAQFSSRRPQITKTALALAEEFGEHPPVRQRAHPQGQVSRAAGLRAAAARTGTPLA